MKRANHAVLISVVVVCSLAAAGCQLDTVAAEPSAQLALLSAPSGVRCRFLTDTSGTVSVEVRREAEKALIERLPALLSTVRCSSLEVGGFTDEGWFVRTTWIDLPDERAVTASSDKGDVLDIFGGKKQLDEQKKAELREESRALRAQSLKRVAAAAQKVFDGLETPKRRHCTAIGDLAGLLNRMEAAFDVVITDGKEDCQSALPNLRMRHPVIFIIVPEKGELATTGGLAIERGRLLEEHLQGARFILPAEIALGEWLSAPIRRVPTPAQRSAP